VPLGKERGCFSLANRHLGPPTLGPPTVRPSLFARASLEPLIPASRGAGIISMSHQGPA
jgi:hypothetical protein